MSHPLQSRYELLPPFCPIHCVPAPCLCCLQSEVVKTIASSNCFDYINVVFAPPSMLEN